MKPFTLTQTTTKLWRRCVVALLALAIASANLPQWITPRATAAVAEEGARTDLAIFPLSGTATLQQFSDKYGWTANNPQSIAGYNVVRTFRNNNNQSFAFLLNGNTGRAQTMRVNADETLGDTTWETGLEFVKDLRCTSAETVRTGGLSYLITHDSYTGKIRTFRFYENGQPNFGSMTATANVRTLADWKDKNVFSLFYRGGAYGLLGVDTWTGNAVAYSLDFEKLGEADWTRGWTNIDHRTTGNGTFRLMYKAAGDPYKKTGEANDQRGRFVIQSINADGVSGQNVYDETLVEGFTSVRFVTYFEGQLSKIGVLFFKRDVRQFVIRAFDPQSGLGAIKDFGAIQINGATAPPYVDIEPYTIGTNSYLAMLSDDNSKPFAPAAAETMGLTMHEGLKDKAVGYQFMLAQSGRIIYSRAHGMAKLGDDPNYTKDDNEAHAMTSRTRLDLGSVSKLITTTTVLKLVSQGKLSLNDKIADHIDNTPLQYEDDSWVKQMTVRDLLTHTTGMKYEAGVEDACAKSAATLKVDCKPFFSSPQTVALGANGYGRSYNNSNIVAARKVIEKIENLTTSPQLVERTGELWANELGMTSLSCQHSHDVAYHGRARGEGTTFPYNGDYWRQGMLVDSAEYSADEPNWSSQCSAGAWAASSRQMIEFMGALRYQKILSPTENDLFLSTSLKDGNDNATAMGWDTPWDAQPGDGRDWQLQKSGANSNEGYGTRAYVTRLPNNTDAVLLINTAVAGPEGFLQGAYKYAVGLAEAPALYYDFAVKGSSDGGTISRVAVNEVKTTATQNQHVVAYRKDGNLKLAAYNVSTDEGGVELKDTHGATSADGALTIPAQDVAITNGVHFATASVGNDDKLNVIGWKYDGTQLSQYGMGVGVAAQEVAITKSHSSAGTQGRVVTAVRTAAGNLRLDMWEFNNTTKAMVLKDSYAAGAAQEIAIKS
ncbi:MAG: serine hydrolase, partial [Acidobacteria bacterium]|nr:serine hydrolase [Acidobacteriota bacterium]